MPRGKTGAHRSGHQPNQLALLHTRRRGLVPFRVLCRRVQAALPEQEGLVSQRGGCPGAGEVAEPTDSVGREVALHQGQGGEAGSSGGTDRGKGGDALRASS